MGFTVTEKWGTWSRYLEASILVFFSFNEQRHIPSGLIGGREVQEGSMGCLRGPREGGAVGHQEQLDQYWPVLRSGSPLGCCGRVPPVTPGLLSFLPDAGSGTHLSLPPPGPSAQSSLAPFLGSLPGLIRSG